MQRIICVFAVLCLMGIQADTVHAADTVTIRVATPDQFQAELKKHKGKVVIVDFWATWCVPCIKSFPHTVEWHTKYRKNGLVVITMCMDDKDDKADALEFLQKKKAACVNLMSSDGGEEEAMKKYGVNGGAIPHYKVYNRRGTEAHTFGADPEKSFSHKDVEAAIIAELRKR